MSAEPPSGRTGLGSPKPLLTGKDNRSTGKQSPATAAEEISTLRSGPSMGISSSISRRRRQGRERSPILKRRPGVGPALGYPGRKRRSGSLIFAPAKPNWPGCSTRISFWRPFVIGNLALGNVKNRDAVLTALLDLPAAILASDAKVLNFIDRRALFGRGVGYVDAHLLAAARLTAAAKLWMRDKRLRRVADALGLKGCAEGRPTLSGGGAGSSMRAICRRGLR